MDNKDKNRYIKYLSPFHLSLLAINGICFGGCLVLLAVKGVSGPLILLTIASGLLFLGEFSGTFLAIQGINSFKNKD